MTLNKENKPPKLSHINLRRVFNTKALLIEKQF